MDGKPSRMTPDQQRAAIEDRVLALFSGDALPLGEMKTAAYALEQAEAVATFHTPVPWEIGLPDGMDIKGFSYNLAGAAKDVYAQLHLLTDSYGVHARVRLRIDGARLHEIAGGHDAW